MIAKLAYLIRSAHVVTAPAVQSVPTLGGLVIFCDITSYELNRLASHVGGGQMAIKGK